jgi:hypothetical protein
MLSSFQTDSPTREGFTQMKNESFWLLALIAVILVCAALEVQQSNSAADAQIQGSTAR